MHPDHAAYSRFAGPSKFDRAVNSLIGIIEGITADGEISDSEAQYLADWLAQHEQYRGRHPFNELVPVIADALQDDEFSDDELQDILWLCQKLRSTEYHNATTADMQRLHAIMGAIVADGIVTADELRGLSDWLSEHESLRTFWPYDEVESIVASVLADQTIDADEQAMLKAFFSEFQVLGSSNVVTHAPVAIASTVQGVCASCPEIVFEDSLFCFTGASERLSRAQFCEAVTNVGGRVAKSIVRDLNYLVIGCAGNPCWTYSCYGRKIEQAVMLRKQGSQLLLVHENDFHDALADL